MIFLYIALVLLIVVLQSTHEGPKICLSDLLDLNYSTAPSLYDLPHRTDTMASEEKAIGISSSVDTGMDMGNIKHVDPTIEKHAHDADEAMKALGNLHGETIELDEATNRRLLKIIDWHMMPIMCFIYGMNYLDSMCISFLDFVSYSKEQSWFYALFCWLFIQSEVLICDLMCRNHSLLCQRYGS